MGKNARYGKEYIDWKDWDKDSFATLSKHDAAIYTATIRKASASFPPNCSVLEIGFGNGGFLAYGNKQRWQISGTEMNPILLERTNEKGYKVVSALDFDSLPENKYDLVVALDVLEHIEQDNIFTFLENVIRLLKDGGTFIARFPNGDSPFGRFTQNGDISHVTTIGSIKAKSFTKKFGAKLIYIGAEAQPLYGGLLCLVHQLFSMPIRYFMDVLLNLVYSPKKWISFSSPNLLLIFKVEKHISN
jgi:SAM-dependent methyltransferase